MLNLKCHEFKVSQSGWAPHCRHAKVNLITTTLLIRVHNCYFTVNRSNQFHIMELSILFYLNNSTNSRFFYVCCYK